MTTPSALLRDDWHSIIEIQRRAKLSTPHLRIGIERDAFPLIGPTGRVTQGARGDVNLDAPVRMSQINGVIENVAALTIDSDMLTNS